MIIFTAAIGDRRSSWPETAKPHRRSNSSRQVLFSFLSLTPSSERTEHWLVSMVQVYQCDRDDDSPPPNALYLFFSLFLIRKRNGWRVGEKFLENPHRTEHETRDGMKRDRAPDKHAYMLLFPTERRKMDLPQGKDDDFHPTLTRMVRPNAARNLCSILSFFFICTLFRAFSYLARIFTLSSSSSIDYQIEFYFS